MEALAHLPTSQRASYNWLAEALQPRFRHHHQTEVYQARLKKRVREKGEMLSQLAQDVEALVRRLYPTATEEMAVVYVRDYFIDALRDSQLDIYVKQAHPWDLQVALARAFEFEALLKTTSNLGKAAQPSMDLSCQKATVKIKVALRRVSLEKFSRACWSCGEMGHRHR